MTDRRVFLAVVLILGLTLLSCVVAIAVLAAMQVSTPGILENLAVGSLTGLAGILAKGPHDDVPQNVNVVNAPTDPVPVDPGPGDKGAGEARLILAVAAAVLLALIVWHFLAPHLH